MKITLSFLSVAFFILFSAGKLSAQNLVPNPSFEERDTLPGFSDCPEGYSDHFYQTMRMAKGWDSFGNSSDYFNACDSFNLNMAGVPANEFGYQAAFGNAYCGFYAYYSGNYRELIGRQLSTQLIQNVKYYVSIKVSLADVGAICACNKLGVLFSTVSYSDTTPAPVQNHSQIYCNNIISDTTYWTIISGSFISDSAYNYIIIGDFFTNQASDSIVLYGNIISEFNPCFSYYYIDDVCVSPDSLECDLNPEGIYNLPQQQIAIYPNPATEQLIIDNGQLIIKGIEIFDLVGRKMMDDELLVNNSNHYSINTKNLQRGYYFIRIHTSEGMINRKIVLQ